MENKEVCRCGYDGVIRCFSAHHPLSRLQDLLPQGGHMLKQSSLALLFLWLRLNHPKKVTAKVSPTFSQGSPSSFASFGFTSSCSLAYVWLSSVNCLSASSSGTLEFHVRKSKPTPLKTRIAALSTHAIDQPYLPQRWCHHDFLHMLWVFSS